MKKLLAFLFSAIFAVLCAGCQNTDKPDSISRVVTEITITREPDHITHRYTNQDSMEQILSYIRRLKPYGKVETTPETIQGENYQITVFLSDGTQRLYQQNGQSYFRTPDKHWLQIDPEAAEELPILFNELRNTTAASQ